MEPIKVSAVFFVTAVLGIVFFVLRRLDSLFYGRLGTSPSEIGRDYAETLSSSGRNGYIAVAVIGTAGVVAMAAAEALRSHTDQLLMIMVAPVIFVLAAFIGLMIGFDTWVLEPEIQRVQNECRGTPSVNSWPAQAVVSVDPPLDSGTYLLLGRNSTHLVIFDCGSNHTIRLPARVTAITTAGRVGGGG